MCAPSMVAPTSAAASAGCETSPTTLIASPPAARAIATVSPSGSARTSLSVSLSSSLAKRSAVARPIPRAAPVMIAIFPYSRMAVLPVVY